MDTKLTLHYNKDVIESAKAFAEASNISLSHLTEFLYRNITSGNYRILEELPVAKLGKSGSRGQSQVQETHVQRHEKKDTQFPDLEDGRQYYSAPGLACHVIITSDLK